ncbi:leucine-zipper-like transcriptional regulator 1 [Python bivittatus]|uniref:Leucine-zipper-like transcriptional regulator 1 n=1 Tax=Python bivittatus TaxID=176946 RepID=A0A9F5MZ74_PYTBI|nr:leucine-zipper-like transcriptional regulator 1 [Python bivittatus]XP_025022134.1 leucine-zipper-like transcriptional regulator 1 [Python bivittatus]XP_025022135.1 leucine-zipper-like transcriptional regulator 1 [Python bivittatus]
MKGKTGFSWNPVEQSKISPCDRYKHACCICRGFLYVYGGRRNTSLSDFWRFKIGSNEWEKLENSKDGPEELEEHTMVDYQDILYIFGGMVDSAFTQKRNPLWMYDTDSTKWIACQLPAVEGEVLVPVNRKGHSAVVYSGNMYIYGGYIDIKGASQEFWTFHFSTKQWAPVSAASSGGSPGPRHGHSAVVYGNGMYLFGGLMKLTEQKDFWMWDFIATNWSSIRKSQGPPRVVGHSALIFEDSMLVLGGGISSTKPSSTLWQYHFPSQMWKKLPSPMALSSKAYHHMLGTGFGFQGAADSLLRSPGCLNSKEKGCSKLLALSKQHVCFCEHLHREPTYQILNNEGASEIEMKTFCQSSEKLGFSSYQTTSSAELNSDPAAELLCKERTSYLSISKEQEFATMDLTAGGSCLGLLKNEYGDVCESSVVMLLVGGKPLSSSSAISFWQLELNRT